MHTHTHTRSSIQCFETQASQRNICVYVHPPLKIIGCNSKYDGQNRSSYKPIGECSLNELKL